MSDLFTATYNPDVLSCLANLSNDEVFTPPEIVNQMLDMLPEEIWHDKNATFLDPACKSGVFLREIAKRLIEAQLPNYEQISYEINEKLRTGGELDGRDIAFQNMLESIIEHVFKNQVFGIAITELTSLLSRRSVYCSKYPQSEYSVVRFDNPEGHIDYKQIQHTWKNSKCIYCGASESEYDREEGKEQYAYEFIHLDNPEEVFDMKFDVIVSNPPYQLNVGEQKKNYAIPIYQKFVEQAKKLNPRYLTMIIPARWYAGGRGLDEFRNEMLHDERIVQLADYPNSADCFPGVDIAGGICYFLWDRDNPDDCLVKTIYGTALTSEMKRRLLEPGLDSFIKQNEAIPILKKVQALKEPTFDSLVSAQTPFGLISSFKDFVDTPKEDFLKYYTYGHVGYIRPEQVKKGKNYIGQHKVYISKAYGERGPYPYFFLGKPFYGEPQSCCSQTYLVIGGFSTKKHCENVMSYISTKFFRFMVMLKKNAQDNMSYVFGLVPIQDFSKPWTDEELYEKYGITEEEQTFIDSCIKPMDIEVP